MHSSPGCNLYAYQGRLRLLSILHACMYHHHRTISLVRQGLMFVSHSTTESLHTPSLYLPIRLRLPFGTPLPRMIPFFLIDRPLTRLCARINHLIPTRHGRPNTRQPSTMSTRVIPLMSQFPAGLSLARTSEAGMHVT